MRQQGRMGLERAASRNAWARLAEERSALHGFSPRVLSRYRPNLPVSLTYLKKSSMQRSGGKSHARARRRGSVARVCAPSLRQGPEAVGVLAATRKHCLPGGKEWHTAPAGFGGPLPPLLHTGRRARYNIPFL